MLSPVLGVVALFDLKAYHRSAIRGGSKARIEAWVHRDLDGDIRKDCCSMIVFILVCGP